MALRSPDISPYWATIGLEGFMACQFNPLMILYVESIIDAVEAIKPIQLETEESLSWCNLLAH